MVVHGQNIKLEWDLIAEDEGEEEGETFSGLETQTSGKRPVAEQVWDAAKGIDSSGWTKVRARPEFDVRTVRSGF